MTTIRVLVGGLAAIIGAAQAHAEARVEFILDGSGSMLGKAGGEAKVTAAKRVMSALLRDIKLPPDSTIGLTLYGHRRKGDCADIERLGPVGYARRERLVAAVAALKAKGRTPIADSLAMVGESLKAREGATSIVLVSDGIESCGKDPCAVARKLRERYGINLVIHVVGFDVRKGQDQLKCIARAGGGGYHAAADPQALAKKLGAIRVAVQTAAKPKIITVTASPLSAILVTPLTLEGFPKVEEIGIFKSGYRKRCASVYDWYWGERVARAKEAGKKIVVTPGAYDIVVKTAGAPKTTRLVVGLEVPSKRTVTVNTDRAIAAIKVPKMKGIEHKGVYVVTAGQTRSAGTVTNASYHIQAAKTFGVVMPVEADCPYDVLLNTGQTHFLPIAEKVAAKPGGLLVIK